MTTLDDIAARLERIEAALHLEQIAIHQDGLGQVPRPQST